MANAFESHVSFARGRLSRAAGRIGPTRHKDRTVLAELVKGPQAGSLAILDAESFTVGHDIEDDLFVFGAEDAGSIEVRVAPTFVGPLLSVRTSRADVSLNGRPIKGMAGPEKLPCELCIDGSVLRFRPPHDLIKGRRSRSSAAPLFAAIAVGAAVLTPLATGPGEAHMIRQRAALSAAAPDPVTLRERAQDMVTEAGLGDLIEMQQDQSGTITLAGVLTAAQGELWSRLRPRLDAELGGLSVRDAVTVQSTPSRFPGISMVVRGPRPFLVLSDGSRRYAGSVVADGFKLLAVDGTHFHLSRGDEEIAVAY